LETIILFLKEKLYSKAAISIEQFINQHNNLSVFVDPEIQGLKIFSRF